jgi:hypothetical protein
MMRGARDDERPREARGTARGASARDGKADSLSHFSAQTLLSKILTQELHGHLPASRSLPIVSKSTPLERLIP